MEQLPPDYDLDEAIKAVPGALRAKPLDLSNDRLVQFVNPMRNTCLKLRRTGNWDDEGISEAERDLAKELLWLYYKNEELGPAFRNKPALAENVLKNYMNPAFHIPEDFRLIAVALYKKFEACDWAPPRIEEESNDSNQVGVYRPAPSTHSIYGLHGILHHIEVSRGGKKTSYQITPGYRNKDAKVIGPNGLVVGDCWALQLAAVRDGAHGAAVAGISGSANAGVYSIIVAGTYKDIDEDYGEHLYYTTSDAHQTKAPRADRSGPSTQALLKSHTTKNNVRVLRKSTSKWIHSPREGLRYDGLYRITSCKEKTNAIGGKYLAFRFDRQPGQAPIAINRPNAGEIRDMRAAKLGY